ncbi:hypothetical protein ACFCT7_06840 [Fulvivirgaceae bacterium LMO-SS25]
MSILKRIEKSGSFLNNESPVFIKIISLVCSLVLFIMAAYGLSSVIEGEISNQKVIAGFIGSTMLLMLGFVGIVRNFAFTKNIHGKVTIRPDSKRWWFLYFPLLLVVFCTAVIYVFSSKQAFSPLQYKTLIVLCSISISLLFATLFNKLFLLCLMKVIPMRR